MERTIRPCSFADGAAFVEYDYDDTTGQLLRVRGVNDSDAPMTVRIRGSADSGQARNVEHAYTFDAHSGTTEWDIPPGQRKRFTLTPDSGSPDPFDTLTGLKVEAGHG